MSHDDRFDKLRLNSIQSHSLVESLFFFVIRFINVTRCIIQHSILLTFCIVDVIILYFTFVGDVFGHVFIPVSLIMTAYIIPHSFTHLNVQMHL